MLFYAIYSFHYKYQVSYNSDNLSGYINDYSLFDIILALIKYKMNNIYLILHLIFLQILVNLFHISLYIE